MNEFALMFGGLATVLFWLAWRERSAGNGRDARLLAGVGAFTGVGALLAELV